MNYQHDTCINTFKLFLLFLLVLIFSKYEIDGGNFNKRMTFIFYIT